MAGSFFMEGSLGSGGPMIGNPQGGFAASMGQPAMNQLSPSSPNYQPSMQVSPPPTMPNNHLMDAMQRRDQQGGQPAPTGQPVAPTGVSDPTTGVIQNAVSPQGDGGQQVTDEEAQTIINALKDRLKHKSNLEMTVAQSMMPPTA